jgi:hypothetical protein
LALHNYFSKLKLNMSNSKRGKNSLIIMMSSQKNITRLVNHLK